MSIRDLNKAEINERAQHFLKALIERYIQEGQPVGSRTLAKDAGLDLSPATIRNVMSDLEDLGLVASPHTSAGRIPTASGYRVFLDSLITLKPLDKIQVDDIKSRIGRIDEPGQLIQTASQLLSGITNMAGVVRLPDREPSSFRQIEFISLSESRVLTILVTSDGEVSNRIITTDKAYSKSELEQAQNYLNGKFSGCGMSSVRDDLLSDMRQDRNAMDQIMARAMEMAEKVVQGEGDEADYLIAGQTNLMDFDELGSMEKLKGLFDAFTEKQQILHLLDRCMGADGVQIFIGEESGYKVLDGVSMVTAPYQAEGQIIGVLGVIGPTRMAYQNVIPIVDVTARLLSAALKPR